MRLRGNLPVRAGAGEKERDFYDISRAEREQTPVRFVFDSHPKPTHYDMKRNTFLTTLLSGVAVALTVGTALQAQDNNWKPLFNGKDFTGWVVRGGKAPFAIENGEIVGTVIAGTPNTFLCTEKDYGDFVLELEFNCHKDVNSGVQIRSEYNENKKVAAHPPLPGKARVSKDGKYKSGPNHISGYQIEIEFAPGRTAGIYD